MIASMTGFARVSGSHGPWRFGWEVRSVNGKGLDLRLRLPPGFEALESDVRSRTGQVLSRGSVAANLTASREGEASTVRVNQGALEALYRAMSESAHRLGAAAPTLDSLLAVKGMVEITEAEDSEEDRRALMAAVLDAFDRALAELGAMREREGSALNAILTERLDAITGLVSRAERLPERSVDAVRARIADQVRVLMEAASLDPERLHQEAILAVTKADVREELFAIHLRRRSLDPAGFDLPALATASDGFSGAEIEQAIVAAMYAAHAAGTALSDFQVRAELKQTRPLSVLMSEQVTQLREWARGRTVAAD